MNQQTLANVRYTHDAMIDMIVAEPSVSQNTLAARFGFSPSWVSCVINSDAFQAKLHERKAELVDPILLRSIEERLKGIAQRSLDQVLEKLDNCKPEFALESAKFATAALGYGAKLGGGQGGNVNFVVNLPQPIADAREWAAAHRQGGGPVVAEAKEIANG